MRRWFFLALLVLAGFGLGLVGASGRRTSSIPSIPDFREEIYKNYADRETMMYIHDTTAILQKEHQEILETLDQIKERLSALEKKIESSKTP